MLKVWQEVRIQQSNRDVNQERVRGGKTSSWETVEPEKSVGREKR
jgi:hypothetical protein